MNTRMGKTKFRDTKVGEFLMEKIPQAAGLLADALPDQGALGIAKNLIQGSSLSSEEKNHAMTLLNEQLQIEAADRDSARSREIELAKVGKMDWMMKVVGLVILMLLVFCVVTVFFFDIRNKDMAHLILGEIIGFAAGMVFYYYGTSKSSSDKTTLLKQLKS